MNEISRRKALSMLGLATAWAVGVPTALLTGSDNADAQQATTPARPAQSTDESQTGTERRQTRRTERVKRRKRRRTARQTGRQKRRSTRRGATPDSDGTPPQQR